MQETGKRKIKFLWLYILLAVVVLTVSIPLIVGGSDALSAVGMFITDQILGMKWLNALFESLFGAIFGADFLLTWYGKSVVFFFYDTIKIAVLLCLLIFGISYVQSFFPPERTKKILSKFGGIKGNILGAVLGTLTPFCSCSSIPIFIGFTKAGIRRGVTFSFLISSPLVDLAALLVLAGEFNFTIAIAYVIVGLVIAVVGGSIIEKITSDKDLEDIVFTSEDQELNAMQLTKKERLVYAKDAMVNTFTSVLPYILIGVGIGALIHNVIPQSFIEAVLGQGNPFSVLIATVIGIPMYADIFGTIPIATALFAKGVGIGTVLSFMMSVTALSLPSIIMLRRAVKPKLLAIFVGIVAIGIIIMGYSFNALGVFLI